MNRIMRHPPFFAIVAVFLLLISSTGVVGAWAFFQQTHPASIQLSCAGITVYFGENMTEEDILADYTPVDFGTLAVNGGGLESDNLTYWAKNTGDVDGVAFGVSLTSIAPELTLMVKSDNVTSWTEVPVGGPVITLTDGGLNQLEFVKVDLKLVVDPLLATSGLKALEIVFEGDTE